MSTVKMMEEIKKVHPFDVAIVKIGCFYHVYGKDSYIIAYLLNYKLKTEAKCSVCGFSEKVLPKVKSRLEREKINYIVLDRRNSYEVDEISDNKDENAYGKVWKLAAVYVDHKKRIESIYDYLIQNIEKPGVMRKLKKIEDFLAN